MANTTRIEMVIQSLFVFEGRVPENMLRHHIKPTSVFKLQAGGSSVWAVNFDGTCEGFNEALENAKSINPYCEHIVEQLKTYVRPELPDTVVRDLVLTVGVWSVFSVLHSAPRVLT